MEEKPNEVAKCPVCGNVGQWKNVDEYRFKPQGMSICQGCGFVSYPDVITNQAKLTEFYREEYRDAPTFNNIITGERKLHYHASFLGPVFNKWKEEKRDAPVVCEIGSAFGMFLHWFKQVFPKADVHGTELTRSYVRNAYWLYGLQLKDAIDTTKQYDLIASYKVAEHQPKIDEELAKYASCLKPDGLLYISVPTWFWTMKNFGATGFSLEYYYHKNHINVWSRKLFETLLAKSGLEIVGRNHVFYDDTYLCRRNDAMKALAPAYEDPADIESRMAKIFQAATAFDAGDYEKALTAYPDFPDAHAAYYESKRAQHHKKGFDWIYENIAKRALEASPNSAQPQLLAADVAMRYSKWDVALKHLETAVKMLPNDAGILMHIAACYRQMANSTENKADGLKFISEARNVCSYARQFSQQLMQEATTWLMHDNAKLPTPFEQSPA